MDANTPQGAVNRASPEQIREELKRTRLEAKLAEERVRLARSQRHARLLEGIDWYTGQPGWSSVVVSPEPLRADQAPPSLRGQNKGGKNFPLIQNEIQLASLRGQSRLMAITNPYAIGMIEGLASYVLGPGYQYRASPRPEAKDNVPDELTKACQYILDEFAIRTRWYGGEEPGVEDDSFARSIGDGEFFHALFECDGYADLRIIEPEQVVQPPGTTFEEYGFGIRTPEDDVQKVEAYNVCWNDNTNEEFPADQIVHFRRNARRGQKRGIPDFSYGTFDALNLAALLVGNLGETAAEQAAIVGVRQHIAASESDVQAFADSQADTTRPKSDGTSEKVKRMRAGRWEDMGENSAYVPGPINQNGAVHLSIHQAVLRAAGTRWNAPEWIISGDASNNNYASALAAESPFARTIIRRQRGYREAFKISFVFALRSAANAGRIVAGGKIWAWEDLTKVIDVLVESMTPETRNRLQEAQQAAIEIPLGVDSRQRYAQSQGRDWNQIQQDNEEFLASTGDRGNPLPMPGDSGAV